VTAPLASASGTPPTPTSHSPSRLSSSPGTHGLSVPHCCLHRRAWWILLSTLCSCLSHTIAFPNYPLISFIRYTSVEHRLSLFFAAELDVPHPTRTAIYFWFGIVVDYCFVGYSQSHYTVTPFGAWWLRTRYWLPTGIFRHPAFLLPERRVCLSGQRRILLHDHPACWHPTHELTCTRDVMRTGTRGFNGWR